jgi:hypothetical protein
MRSIYRVAVGVFAATAFAADPVTFHKHVEPLLQKSCQSCHRPGQVAPMSFLSYESARPWAKAMKSAVITRKMPPWFADAHYGHFTNDRSLKQADIDTISRWADAGAPEGNASDAPPPVKWPADGWEIEPDFIVNGPDSKVPAKPTANVIEWTYITVPSGFKEDTWVTSMEIRPSEPSVTHHICVYFKPHTPGTQDYRLFHAAKLHQSRQRYGIPASLHAQWQGRCGSSKAGLYSGQSSGRADLRDDRDFGAERRQALRNSSQ